MSGIMAFSGNDMVIENGLMVIYTGVDSYVQRLKDNLRFNLGEYILDPEWGTPWLELLSDEEIQTANPYINLVRSIILSTDDTESVESITTVYNTTTRKLEINAKIQSIYGLIDFRDTILIEGGS